MTTAATVPIKLSLVRHEPALLSSKYRLVSRAKEIFHHDNSMYDRSIDAAPVRSEQSCLSLILRTAEEVNRKDPEHMIQPSILLHFLSSHDGPL
jgi:hypothetical protein